MLRIACCALLTTLLFANTQAFGAQKKICEGYLSTRYDRLVSPALPLPRSPGEYLYNLAESRNSVSRWLESDLKDISKIRERLMVEEDVLTQLPMAGWIGDPPARGRRSWIGDDEIAQLKAALNEFFAVIRGTTRKASPWLDDQNGLKEQVLYLARIYPDVHAALLELTSAPSWFWNFEKTSDISETENFFNNLGKGKVVSIEEVQFARETQRHSIHRMFVLGGHYSASGEPLLVSALIDIYLYGAARESRALRATDELPSPINPTVTSFFTTTDWQPFAPGLALRDLRTFRMHRELSWLQRKINLPYPFYLRTIRILALSERREREFFQTLRAIVQNTPKERFYSAVRDLMIRTNDSAMVDLTTVQIMDLTRNGEVWRRPNF